MQGNEQAESSSAHKVSDESVRFVAVTATSQAITTSETEGASSEDREFVELLRQIKEGKWKGVSTSSTYQYAANYVLLAS